eukprot:836497-Amphidinium_carterae.1
MEDLEGLLKASLRYIGLGAMFDESDLLKLTKLGCDLVNEKVEMRTGGNDWRRETRLLHVAAWFGHVEPMKYLLDIKIDVDARDEKGWTPLIFAARSGRVE